MDPNETLRRIRDTREELANAEAVLQGAAEGDSNDAEIEAGRYVADVALHLSELVEALDGWLAGGGFLPDAWQR